MIYCISDIHGHYEKWCAMLEKINLTDEDLLYVLGDVCDRGPDTTKVLQDMMDRTNVIPLAGNHDLTASYCLNILSKELTDENAQKLDMEAMQAIMEWLSDGGQATATDFRKITPQQREDLLAYLEEFALYAEVTVSGQAYILVHAGLENFSEKKDLDAYSVEELLFGRMDYAKKYFENKIIVTGHTPTMLIQDNPQPGCIYRANNHIAIDCGCGFGNRLGAICLDTGEVFYVE